MDIVKNEYISDLLGIYGKLLTDYQLEIMELYYYEDLTLKEISLVLEVSESRVSQLHTKALLKMRKKMGAYMDILVD